jgi:NAD(P)-dependent dehydrogenase (short-subunit alcohol dehydrogenase family)
METAVHLASRGFRVYATLRDPSRREALDDVARQRGVSLRVLRLDVTVPSTIEDAVGTIVEESGGVFGLVNNAGLLIRGYFEDLLDREIHQIFDTNVFGTMAVTRAVLPHMRAARRGRIVIVTSVAGKIGAPSGSAYSASRFAQEGFGESLNQEVEPLGIRVVLVEPGITKTQRWTIEMGAGERVRDPAGPYHDWYLRAERLFNEAMESSPITTSDVARTIDRALTAPRPRLRYVVGRRASGSTASTSGR